MIATKVFQSLEATIELSATRDEASSLSRTVKREPDGMDPKALQVPLPQKLPNWHLISSVQLVFLVTVALQTIVGLEQVCPAWQSISVKQTELGDAPAQTAV